MYKYTLSLSHFFGFVLGEFVTCVKRLSYRRFAGDMEKDMSVD